jgi:SAM-dependent methyltransferase
MNIHIALARALIRLGAFIQSFALMVMTPDDLVAFSRQSYAKPWAIDSFTREDVIKSGLNPAELQLLEHLPTGKGQLLVLGMGGGREAIAFAQMGFDVTGVDFIPAMVEGALANAARHNTIIKGLVQDIAVLDLPAETYDVIWLFAAMYSCVPTRARRVQMLQRAQRALRPGGYFACQFSWQPQQTLSSMGVLMWRIAAWLTLGNRSYERGDMLWRNLEFKHNFSSESELHAEFAAGGFSVAWQNLPTDLGRRGEALLQKHAE